MPSIPHCSAQVHPAQRALGASRVRAVRLHHHELLHNHDVPLDEGKYRPMLEYCATDVEIEGRTAMFSCANNFIAHTM